MKLRSDAGNYVGTRTLIIGKYEETCQKCKRDLDLMRLVYYCPSLKQAFCGDCFRNKGFYHSFSFNGAGEHTDVLVDKLERIGDGEKQAIEAENG